MRIKRIAAAYEGRLLKVFDGVLLVFIAVLFALQILVGLQPLSFITGLMIGLTLTQLVFHRFDRPLTAAESPPGARPAGQDGHLRHPGTSRPRLA